VRPDRSSLPLHLPVPDPRTRPLCAVVVSAGVNWTCPLKLHRPAKVSRDVDRIPAGAATAMASPAAATATGTPKRTGELERDDI
jgi:hypothetical protein